MSRAPRRELLVGSGACSRGKFLNLLPLKCCFQHFFVRFFFKIQCRASEKTADFLVISTFFILTIRACNPGTKLMAIQNSHRSYTPHPRLPAPLLAMASNSCKNAAASRLSNSAAAAICRTPLWPERKRHITSSQHGCSRERPFTETPLSGKPFDPAKWLF